MILDIPELLHTDGRPRKVGLELEFAGLELDKTAAIIQQHYGGAIEIKNRYQYTVKDTVLGDFKVELDARILKKMAGTDFFKEWNLDIDEQKLSDSIGEILDKVAMTVVPVEIVMPPVSNEDLDKLEPLRESLQKQKAEGTESSWMHAFGLHINIESPDLEVATLLTYLRSFFILYPWLLNELDIDISRRLSPFIDPFHKEYVRLILNDDYDPSQQQFIGDYLTYNPTRNRPLDMMPILALLDNERVSKVLGDEKNKARPTFHYRLPSSRVNDPEWNFEKEWKKWLHIESLVSNNEMLAKLSQLYLLREGETLVSFRKEWAQTAAILLDLNEES